ncbi:hypothetical protein OIO90_002973 [Microbotryomycetes sp. JL221]|nr:hypothetical protein OIO90_002973 [Microbotryomycetes sp. JL221]
MVLGLTTIVLETLAESGVQQDTVEHAVDNGADTACATTLPSTIPSFADAPVHTTQTTLQHATKLDEGFAEQLKYVLATSALLTPRLTEALSLYRLNDRQSAAPQASATTQLTLTRSANVASWGPGWDVRGQSPLERSVGDSLDLVVQCAANLLGRLRGGSAVTKPGIAIKVLSPPPIASATPPWQTTFLHALNHFVLAAQKFDLGADPLPPISRFEARSLSQSQPASSPLARSQSQPTPRPRLPSPLSLTPPRSNEGRAPSLLQAISTRSALITAIESLSLLFLRISASIETLSGLQKPLETSAEVPLALDRSTERGYRNRTSDVIPLSRKLSNRSKRLSWNSDLASSQTSDTTFGGVDRKVGLSPAMRHRSRPSLSSISVSSLGDDALNTPVKGSRRRRPASWGMWSGQNVAAALQELGESSDASIEATGSDDDRYKLSTIDQSLQDMYDARRTMLWRLLELVNRLSTNEKWLKIQAILNDATSEMDAATLQVETASKAELPAHGDELKFGKSNAVGHMTDMTASDEYGPREAWQCRSDSQSIGFAPPGPSAAHRAQRALDERQAAVSLALRSIAAKSQLATNDARHISDSPAIEQALARHDSIRDDIAALTRAWEESRLALRAVLRPDILQTARNVDSDAVRDVGDEEDVMTATSTYLSSELDDSAVEHGEHVHDVPVVQPGPIFDDLRVQREEVYEAETEPFKPKVSSKLTREERIKMMKERRQQENESVTPQNLEAPIVAELKEVLGSLKSRQNIMTTL